MKYVIGYRNVIPGDETSDVIPASQFSPDERLLSLELLALREQSHALERQLSDVEDQIIAKVKGCKHYVFNDEPGVIYSFRNCAVCGAYMGTV